MMIYLVHHADAVDPTIDAQRPLSALGLAQADWLAGQAHARGARPRSIWHSGKLRSRQTAEAFLRRCNPAATFQSVRGLLPADPTMWVENALALETEDVLVVGHRPNLPELARALVAGAQLPLHGIVAMERTAILSFEQRWVLAPA